MKILYLIPARGGSKGIPHKNIKPLCGKPLICYSIDAARELADDKDICVSTDDDEIIKTVEDYGLKVPFVRPAEFATDTASSDDVIKHALKWYSSNNTAKHLNGGGGYDIVVLLQPTSPLRTARHVKEALSLYKEGLDMVVSVKPSHAANVICSESEDGFLEMTLNKNSVRRQDMKPYYEYNGAIYVINAKSELEKGLGSFNRVAKYVMPEMDSWDIDTMMDWKIIEMILNDRKSNDNSSSGLRLDGKTKEPPIK